MKTRSTTLTRTGPLKRRTRLSAVSPKKRKADAAKREAYQVVDEKQQCCESCGRREKLSHSHALTQKKWPQFADDPRNVFTLCWYCHMVFEHDKRRFAALSPDVWAKKLAIIKELSPEQYQLLHIKYPDLIPEA